MNGLRLLLTALSVLAGGESRGDSKKCCIPSHNRRKVNFSTLTSLLYDTLPLEVRAMSKMILVIEDEKSLQNIIKAFLEDAEYRVILAADGMEGIERFRKNKPDLVLLDLMLPKIDGFAVCEILRKESQVPIIMLTALDDESSQMKGFNALADNYITKPFSMPVVIKHIEAVLRRTEQGAVTESSYNTGYYRNSQRKCTPNGKMCSGSDSFRRISKTGRCDIPIEKGHFTS